MKKNKVIFRIKMPKNWMKPVGSPSIRYSGRLMYQWSFTVTPPFTDRLNIVYRVIEDD